MRGTALQIHRVESRSRAALAALLPPLALYAALALVLGELFAAPLELPALLLGGAVIAAGELLPKRVGRVVRFAAVLGAVLAFALLPTVRAGAMLLSNRLFGASEAINAYAYEYFEVSDAGETAALRACLCAAAAFGGAFCALTYRRRGAVLALLLLTVFVEAYYGVTPGGWRNLALFAALGVTLARGEREAPSAGDAAVFLTAFAAVALAAFLLAPNPNAAVEAYSEHLRDELGRIASEAQAVVSEARETNRTRRESRLHEEPAPPDEPSERDRREFERQTENEREISRPERIDYAKLALLTLGILALLLVPFLPFVLLDRRRKRAREKRAAFHDADNAAAIRAMFLHVMDWLHACGLPEENRPFADETEAVRALTSDSYAARYAAAVPIWQEAAYSDHELEEDRRIAMRQLLETTEESLYEHADKRTRFRLKYIDCLCEV